MMRLGRDYGHERMEAACRRALALDACSYRSIRSILKTKLDQQPLLGQNTPLVPPVSTHDDIRGKERAREGETTGRVFIRAQFCHYFDAPRYHGVSIRQGIGGAQIGGGERVAVSQWRRADVPDFRGKAIYRTLGIENIRQRRKAGTRVVMRRLLSPDYKKSLPRPLPQGGLTPRALRL